MSHGGRYLVLWLGLAAPACRPKEAPGPPVATDHVTLPASYRFTPAAITVTAGTRVTWVNADHFTHSVRLVEDGGGDLRMRPGDSVSFVFQTPGLHHYDCAVHRQAMRGTVLVTAP